MSPSIKLNRSKLAIALAGVMAAGVANAATNQATDNSSPNFSLTSSGVITVNAAALSIGKEARDLSGNNLGATVTIPSGMKFYFVLYVDNTTSIALSDVRFNDDIDTGAFTVDTASIEAVTLEMTGANDTAWAGSATWDGLSWASRTAGSGDDELDWNVAQAGFLTVGTGATNTQLNIAASTQADKAADPNRYAVRFQVTMN